jgi:hypothetical protein
MRGGLMAEDSHGRILWGTVANELAGQAADQASLTGRAKDLMGVATISTTITGVILNDKLFNVPKVDIPVWWILFAGLSLLAVFGAGIYAIQPRTYSFAPDATDFHQIEQDYQESSENDLYRAMAEGYLFPNDDANRNQLQRNRDILTDIDTAVLVETGGVLGLTAMAFILAFLIDTG